MYRATRREERLAVKVVHNFEGFLDEGGMPMEALTMRTTSHPSVVALHDFALLHTQPPKLWMLLEFCSLGKMSVRSSVLAHTAL